MSVLLVSILYVPWKAKIDLETQGPSRQNADYKYRTKYEKIQNCLPAVFKTSTSPAGIYK